jgi:hypothetical protein
MVLFVSSVSAFLTWLTLSYSQFGDVERLAGSVGVFLAVGGTLLHYVTACMKRHCHHQPHQHPQGHATR